MEETRRRRPPEPPRWFWQAIEGAGGDLESFRAELARLSREQLIQAYAYFDDLARIFTAPVYVVNMAEGMSEDGAFDVGKWIVTQGRSYFRDVYTDPDKVPSSPEPGTRAERLMMGEIMRFYLDTYDDDMPLGQQVEYEDSADGG